MNPEREVRRPSDLEIVRNLACDLLKRNSLEDLLWDLAEAIGRLPGFEDSVVYLAERRVLSQIAAFGKKCRERTIVEPITIAWGQGVVGTVAKTQVAEIVKDTRTEPRYIRDQFDGLSELAVPVVFEGHTLAVLDTESTRLDSYTNADLQLLQTMANIAAPRIASAICERDARVARQELAALNMELETRVEERTQSLRQASEELQSQRDRLSSIVDAVEGGVLAVDHEFRVTSISVTGAEILGVTAGEVHGRPVCDVLRLRGVTDSSTEITRLSDSDGMEDARLVALDGQEIEIRWTANRTSENETAGYVIVFRDCQEENGLREQAVRSQRIESLGVLAAGIAHDFNNCLAAILGAVETAQLIPGSTEVRGVLKTAADACLQARQLSQRFLTYSAGGDPLRQTTELRPLLDSAIALATSGRSVNVSVHTDARLKSVFVDSGQLTQVLSNVLINAAQSVPSGGRIDITAEPSGPNLDQVRITIADTGAGLNRETMERVFDPFFSTRPDGTGMGLTTSHFILKAHGGTIAAGNSRILGGAEFVIEFPIGEGQPVVAPAPKAAEEKPSLRVLVLDDDERVRRSVSTLLGHLGHQVEVASHIAAAKECALAAVAEDRPFDVAIVDLTLGSESGLAAVSELRAIRAETWLIVSSGYSNASVMAEYVAHGFDGVLPKPYTADELSEQLMSAIRSTKR